MIKYELMTDNELLDRMKNAPDYLIDRHDVAELIKRFEAKKAKLYEAEQIIDIGEAHV